MDDDVETESLLDDEILSLLGGCRSWVDVAVGREEGATSAGAFRRGLRFGRRSCRSARGTALRARGADGVERPERRVRRRRRAANIRRDGLTRASVARNQALAP